MCLFGHYIFFFCYQPISALAPPSGGMLGKNYCIQMPP